MYNCIVRLDKRIHVDHDQTPHRRDWETMRTAVSLRMVSRPTVAVHESLKSPLEGYYDRLLDSGQQTLT